MAVVPTIQNLRILELWAQHGEYRARRRTAILQYIFERRRARRQSKRSCWVLPWKTEEQRHQKGAYFQLFQQLKENDVPGFIRYVRIDPELFREMEDRMSDDLYKQDTEMRRAISGAERLAITLRYLATGESFRSLAYQFRCGHNTIAAFVPEVCEAIIKEFGPQVMPEERDEQFYVDCAHDFYNRWNLPNCIGALDGKHVAIKCPAHSGSSYYNYQRFFSIILMAIADAKYRFTYMEVGANGACSDAQVFNHSAFKEGMANGEGNLPDPRPLPNDDKPIPFYLIGDDAFALAPWLMKPYSHRMLSKEERVYNYRISRARRVVESAFGILTGRFRCLLTTLEVDPETATSITMACVILHNLILTRDPPLGNAGNNMPNDGPPNHAGVGGNHPDLVSGLNLPGGNFGSKKARKQRDYLCEYFNSPRGSVEWQEDMI